MASLITQNSAASSTELAHALERKRVRGHGYTVGGAAMTLAFSRKRSTHDVGARIEEGYGAVVEAAQDTVRRHGLADSWLNEQATQFMPRKADERAKTLYDSPSLVVTDASAGHMLAMKLEADQEYVARLVELLRIATSIEGLAIHAELFHDINRPERAQALLDAALRAKRGPTRRTLEDRGSEIRRHGVYRLRSVQSFTKRDPDSVSDENRFGPWRVSASMPVERRRPRC